MKPFLRGIAALMTTAAVLFGTAASAQDKTVLTTDREKASYMVGTDIGHSIAPVGPDLDMAAFEKAIALKPTLDRAWYGMGLAHAVLGRHDKAAEALGRAAELQPMNPYAWYNLGMAYATLGERGKLAEAHRHLGRFDPKMARKLAADARLETEAE